MRADYVCGVSVYVSAGVLPSARVYMCGCDFARLCVCVCVGWCALVLCVNGKRESYANITHVNTHTVCTNI